LSTYTSYTGSLPSFSTPPLPPTIRTAQRHEVVLALARRCGSWGRVRRDVRRVEAFSVMCVPSLGTNNVFVWDLKVQGSYFLQEASGAAYQAVVVAVTAAASAAFLLDQDLAVSRVGTGGHEADAPQALQTKGRSRAAAPSRIHRSLPASCICLASLRRPHEEELREGKGAAPGQQQQPGSPGPGRVRRPWRRCGHQQRHGNRATRSSEQPYG
jgi:hypothetical protein